jgi:hypothetical protein
MTISFIYSLVVDHLVNNAGVASVCWFEEVPDVADFKQVLVQFTSSSITKQPLQMDICLMI